MTVDAIIAELSGEAAEAMRALLRQAYDRGFREALGTGPRTRESAEPAPARDPGAAEHRPAPAADAMAADDVRARAVEWEDDAGDDGDEGSEPGERDDGSAPARAIWPSASVGTLRRRIIRTFELERFDIDVVICRRGDPTRRQLNAGARLKRYLRSEE
jgi:hypothetical protein